MVVADTAGVGIGTRDPDATLEVTTLLADGTAQILVDENNGTATSRTLLVLENNGKPTMDFVHSSRNRTWTTGFGAQDSFIIKGGPKRDRQLQFTALGALNVKRGSNTTMNLDKFGNLNIDGVVNAASSITVKRDMVPVDGAAVLMQLAALPVATWRYKEDETAARHLGPMAEAFHAAFGLGADDTHIAPTDMAGVALAAIKALQEQNLALQARVAALEERLAGLN